MTDGSARDGRPTVLVVDDEAAFAESAAIWLDDDYDVRIATDGEAAIRAYDREVDAVLLDRRMPGLPGDEALTRIDARPGDAAVAMMTAVRPGYDLVGMPFDSYLRKPVAKGDIEGTVGLLVARAGYPRELRELFGLVATVEALNERYPRHEREGDGRYESLVEALASTAPAVTADLSALHPTDRERFHSGFDAALRGR